MTDITPVPVRNEGVRPPLRLDTGQLEIEATGNRAAVEPDFSDEEALVAALKAGNKHAFHYAVTGYSPQMLAAARSIAGSSSADDVVKDTWLAVFQQIEGFEHRSTLHTWLLRIVSKRAIAYLRSQGREIQVPARGDDDRDYHRFDRAGRWAAPPNVWDAGSPDDPLAASALQDCIDKSLLSMPENQRQVVVMRDMLGLSFDDICCDLELSAVYVRVLLHRGRMRLMGMIDRFQETGSF